MVPLEACKIFRDLTEAEISPLRKIAVERKLAPGETIFKEGDQGDGIYVIADGRVRIASNVANGEPRGLSKLGPGDLFGEMAVLDNDPRSATAVAEGAATVYFMARPDLMEIMNQTPKLAAAFVREVSLRLREFNRQYIREVLEAERLALVGRFASSIVHDLKNPLNIIGISADLACMPAMNQESRDTHKLRIRKQIDRISNMVNELLEFARGSSSSFVLARVNYDVFVHQLIEDIRPEVALKYVTLELENEPPPVKVQINPPRLARVFHNLISNATDAMDKVGKIKLRFSVTDTEIITEVEDTGKGIAPEIADRLFEAFATFGKANGTGLGLSITKRIVQDHRGRIWARPAPDGGALFAFSLPLAKD